MAQRGLGKGLSALISDNYAPPAGAKDTGERRADAQGVQSMRVSELHAGEYQPRTHFDEQALAELADSIRKNGVIQPLIIRPSALDKHKYEIVAGERRWRAAQRAGLDTVPVIIRDIEDRQALEFALVENIQRHDLSALEEAAGYQRLIDEFGYTQEELSTIVGKSRSHIANLLRLQSLPEEVKELLEKGKISMGHARALITAENSVELAHEIINRRLTVRQAELYSKGAGTSKRAPRPSASLGPSAAFRPPVNKDPDIVALEESLSETLGVRVSINDCGQSGEIVLAYESLMQLDEILRKLNSEVGTLV